jgi:hypothetical protein
MQKVVGSSPIIRSLPTESVHSADDQPPICPTCGVTMVPAALSANEDPESEWVCLECEELAEGE